MSITFRRSSTYGGTKSSCRVVAARTAASNGTRFTPALSRSRYSLARSSIHLVDVGVGRAAVRAGCT